MKTNKQVTYVLRRFLLVIVVLLLGILAIGVGLMIGYGLVGKGQDPWAILIPEKWHELISKFTGK